MQDRVPAFVDVDVAQMQYGGLHGGLSSLLKTVIEEITTIQTYALSIDSAIPSPSLRYARTWLVTVNAHVESSQAEIHAGSPLAVLAFRHSGMRSGITLLPWRR
jgi:hypothetical protein